MNRSGLRAAFVLIGTGKITSLPTLQITYKQGPYGAQVHTVTVNAPITTASRACRISNSQISVEMPTFAVQTFPTPGTTKRTTNFSINPNDCPANIKVYTTLTDASNPANVSDILSLTRDSTAAGIGYRVAYGGRAVKFGPDSVAPGTLNQFPVADKPGTSLSIPMEVSYIRTNEQIAAGTAKGQVILNMSYQ